MKSVPILLILVFVALILTGSNLMVGMFSMPFQNSSSANLESLVLWLVASVVVVFVVLVSLIYIISKWFDDNPVKEV